MAKKMNYRDIIDGYPTAKITGLELALRILLNYEQSVEIREIAERLPLEEAEILRRLVEGMVFEGGISINMGTDSVAPETLAKFKRFYGFKIPKKWAHLSR